MGLLTKLNLLTIGLIFLTAIATTGFYVWQQWRDETTDLRQRGAAALAMLAELSEFGLYTNNRAYLEAILESLPRKATSPTRSSSIARATPSPTRRIAESLGTAGPPPAPADALLPAPGATSTTEVTIRRPTLRRADRAGGGTKIATAMGFESGAARARRRQTPHPLRRLPRRRWATSASG